MSEGLERLDRLIERVAAAQAQLLERGRPGRHARMRAEVLARWSAPAPRRPRAWPWTLACSALLAAVLVVWVVAAGPEPWSLRVEEPLQAGQAQLFVAASDDHPVVVSFADGVLTLQPRARVRMEAPSQETAPLVIEAGTIEVELDPAGGSEWTIAAGSYRLGARAASLTVAWEPQTGAFELWVHAGHAWVEGPRFDGVRTVKTGGHLLVVDDDGDRALVPDHEPVAEAIAPAAGYLVGDAEEAAPPLPTRPNRRSRGKRRSAEPPVLAPRPTPGSPWRSLAREGFPHEAIAAAEDAGFSELCALLDAQGLLELADTARYADRTDLAREALLALRRRFSGSDEAAAAAFDLARLAARTEAGCKDATRWLATYVEERPNGPMAKLALERLGTCSWQDAIVEAPAP